MKPELEPIFASACYESDLAGALTAARLVVQTILTQQGQPTTESDLVALMFREVDMPEVASLAYDVMREIRALQEGPKSKEHAACAGLAVGLLLSDLISAGVNKGGRSERTHTRVLREYYVQQRTNGISEPGSKLAAKYMEEKHPDVFAQADKGYWSGSFPTVWKQKMCPKFEKEFRSRRGELE